MKYIITDTVLDQTTYNIKRTITVSFELTQETLMDLVYADKDDASGVTKQEIASVLGMDLVDTIIDNFSSIHASKVTN